jgi:hypothetical protein
MPTEARPTLAAETSAQSVATPVCDRGWDTLERLPKWLICVPLVLQWLWLGARYRSWTLPSAANPAITAGGLVGEGKLEYFESMGPLALAATAPHCGWVARGRAREPDLRAALHTAGLAFPLVAKPDKGLCGYGVRRLDGMDQLQQYLEAFPEGETVVLQAYLAQEGEAGLFYARDPRDDSGRLIGVALRRFPQVVGDGTRTVAQLLARDRRARRVAVSRRHGSNVNLARVPSAGEVVRLSTIGSIRVGGLYLDGGALATPALAAAIDRIARDMPQFHFGRFDVRFASTAGLARGTGFTIMEVNGAGSEAIQAWDPNTGLREGFATIFSKQRLLFEIADSNRRAGTQPIGLWTLARLNRRQQRLNALYPASN